MANETNTQSIRFSVIIPAYNAATTIQRAVASVLSQSYPALEVIVVDDASSDDTEQIVAAMPSPVRYIRKVNNVGSSGARNTGMDKAAGNYIAFLDADDIWHTDKLQLISNILGTMPAIQLFYHPYTQDDIAKRSLPENITLFKLPFVKLLPANVIATSCAVIKNDPKFRFETSMRYTEDYDLWLRIGYKHKIYFIDIPLTRIFRPFLSPGGISASKWKMRKGEMRAYSRLVKLNPLFLPLLPVLWLSSLGKFVYKAFTNK